MDYTELGYWACLGVRRRDTALLTSTTTTAATTTKKKSNVGWAVTVRMLIAKIPNPTAQGPVLGWVAGACYVRSAQVQVFTITFDVVRWPHVTWVGMLFGLIFRRLPFGRVHSVEPRPTSDEIGSARRVAPPI